MKFLSEVEKGEVLEVEPGKKVLVKDVRQVGKYYRVAAFGHTDVWYFHQNYLVETESLTFEVWEE